MLSLAQTLCSKRLFSWWSSSTEPWTLCFWFHLYKPACTHLAFTADCPKHHLVLSTPIFTVMPWVRVPSAVQECCGKRSGNGTSPRLHPHAHRTFSPLPPSLPTPAPLLITPSWGSSPCRERWQPWEREAILETNLLKEATGGSSIVLTSGTKGGSSIPASNRLKFMLLKKGCLFTSAAPSPWHPSRCFTSLVRSWNRGVPTGMGRLSEKQELHKDIFISTCFWMCP